MDENRIKQLKQELADIIRAEYNGADPERFAHRKSAVMDELSSMGVNDGWHEYCDPKWFCCD